MIVNVLKKRAVRYHSVPHEVVICNQYQSVYPYRIYSVDIIKDNLVYSSPSRVTELSAREKRLSEILGWETSEGQGCDYIRAGSHMHAHTKGVPKWTDILNFSQNWGFSFIVLGKCWGWIMGRYTIERRVETGNFVSFLVIVKLLLVR